MTTKEKLEKIKKLADDMYYTAANLGPNVGSGERLRKTMEDYHKFIIHEFNKEEPKNDWLQELQDKLDSLSKENFKKVWAKYQPVSEDLNTEIQRYLRDVHDRDTTVGDVARHFAAWQRQQYIKIFKELSELANHQDSCYALECIQMRLDSLIDEE